jgi:class 3 adenylate cyclase/tetratricopeptide (TPR) repeat protein
MAEREELRRAILALEAQRSVLGDAVVDTMVAAAREKLAALEAQRTSEQRKQVTILFADVSGFTAISGTMDPEEVRDTMNALWQRLDSVIIAHGGTIDKHMGDAVMAIFGAPTAREDDPERAIRAALAMQKEVEKWRPESDASEPPTSGLQSPISIRIGIHTGPVLMGAVGTTGEYTAMGDAVNLTSRLQQAAPVGGVLASHATYRHVRGIFNVMPMEPIVVKGKVEPIPIYVILRAKPRAFRLPTRGVGGIETRMVGRKADLALLQGALREVIGEGESQVITIVGEAGVGKSRLLYEFDNWIALLSETIFHFKGRAGEQMSNMPYFLIRDLLSFHFEIQDSDPAAVARAKLERGISEFMGSGGVEMAHFIGHLIGFDFSASPHLRGILGDARQIRDRAFYYATQLFTTVAQRRPTVVFLEDLHWADEGSLDLIDHVARECRHALLLIVCLARPALFERRPSWGHRQTAHICLELHPLSDEHSRQLVEEILRMVDQIPSDLRDMIVNRTEGNPFYIEEFIKVLIEDRIIVTGTEHWQVNPERLTQVRIPPTLVGVLQARLDRLPLWERELLQRASVVGRVFWDGAVARLCESADDGVDREAIRTGLRALRTKELIFWRDESTFAGEREYAFQHAILHDAAYESVLKRLRRVYHAQVAAWLVEKSGERVSEYAGLIGSHCELAGDMGQAAGWYGQAGKQARNKYAPEVAISYYQKALALLPGEPFKAYPAGTDPTDRRVQQVIMYEGLGEMLLWQARYAEAVDVYTSMQVAAEAARNRVAQARAWNGLSRTQDAQGDYSTALESAGHAERIAGNAGAAGRIELTRALFRKGWCLYRLGDTEAALALGEQALTLSTRFDARREMADSLNLLGGVHTVLGHQGDAAHYNSRAVTLYRELGDQEGIGAMLNHLGEHARLRGDYGAAIALYQEALKIAYETGNRNNEMAFLSNLCGARTGLGEYHVAEYDLRQIIRWAEIAGQGGWLSDTYRFLAQACLGQGKTEEALAAARRALAVGQKVKAPPLIGGAWRTLGVALGRAAEPIIIDGGQWDAEACFAESAQIFTKMDAEGELARTLRAWAEHEIEQGNHARGETMWQEARGLFARLGMEMEASRMAEVDSREIAQEQENEHET